DGASSTRPRASSVGAGTSRGSRASLGRGPSTRSPGAPGPASRAGRVGRPPFRVCPRAAARLGAEADGKAAIKSGATAWPPLALLLDALARVMHFASSAAQLV